MKLSGWGRYPVHDAQVFAPRSEQALAARIKVGGLIARGNGRAYGDSAISRQNTVHMRHLNRLIAFDAETGQVVAEAGVLLADIITAFLPLGWFPAVTPGTKFVTLGGMIAADVHGKNHHRDGCLANFVDWIDLMDATGTVRHCSRLENTDLFSWTIGGMGLTGVILRAAIRLRAVQTAWIKQTTLPAANVDAAITVFEQSDKAQYSVAWIDCLSKDDKLGRSLVMLGEHATPDDLSEPQRKTPFDCGTKRKKSVPFNLPSGLLNTVTARAFNALYYWKGSRTPVTQLVDWDSYFYPLDAILGWNKIYGRKGFAQFQCVLPLDQSRQGLRALLEAISTAGTGSFLAVLKRLGDEQGGFSFPMQGYTLALDFPVNARTLALMNVLDQITLAHGGRFYLAKDSRMTAQTLRLSDVRTEGFVQMRNKATLRPVFTSAQSERLDL
jgi:decaprenylphospho-beta-D-ribofuranose 2-oxidase